MQSSNLFRFKYPILMLGYIYINVIIISKKKWSIIQTKTSLEKVSNYLSWPSTSTTPLYMSMLIISLLWHNMCQRRVLFGQLSVHMFKENNLFYCHIYYYSYCLLFIILILCSLFYDNIYAKLFIYIFLHILSMFSSIS